MPKNLFEYPQIVQRSTLPDQDSQGVYQGSKRWTVSDLASKRQIILDGLGWGRLPQHDIESDLEAGTLVELNHIENTTDLPIYLARSKTRDHGVVCESLWEMFAS